MLATSSCLYAGIGRELLLAVRNYNTYMLYLGEQELLKAGATKDRNTRAYLKTVFDGENELFLNRMRRENGS